MGYGGWILWGVESSYYPSHNNTTANVGLGVSPIGYAHSIMNCPIRRMRDAMLQVSVSDNAVAIK